MSQFLRLLIETDKAQALADVCSQLRAGQTDSRSFELDPKSFGTVPGKPFAYWTTQTIRDLFLNWPPFEHGDRLARQGLSTADDFRFARCWWEVKPDEIRPAAADSKLYKTDPARWYPLLKGGGRSAFVSNFDLVLNYHLDGKEVKAWVSSLYGNTGWSKNIFNTEFYFRRGFSWALRSSRFSPSAVPDGCIFSASRYQAFTCDDDLPWTIALLNSSIVSYLLRMCSERFEHPKYVVGIVAKLPFPEVSASARKRLSSLFFSAAELKIRLHSFDEVSHSFLSPALVASDTSLDDINGKLDRIINEIDLIACNAFGLSKSDIQFIQSTNDGNLNEDAIVDDSLEDEEPEADAALGSAEAVLSWAVGVAFGRFNWHLSRAKDFDSQRHNPFEALPAKSPGMLPIGAEPFHKNLGILVDEQGHPHDIARLIEEVLTRANAPISDDVRRRLQRDFFPLHLKQYSKSRRKAPIYWPISTSSGSYTLWLYYPSLTDQTLFIGVNDFIEPKLKQVDRDVVALRIKGSARSRDDEKALEALQALELELIELRDTLLAIANTYRPNHDDGVQITAAPLWRLFRHAPWQKLLKETWAKLEKGDYDWAHLALAYWPERVREKCKADKSLAIAHDLEGLYVEPDAQPKKSRGKKKAGGDQ